METIFGAERASLKKAISQGGEIEATLERLFALNAIKPAERRGDQHADRLVGRPGAKAQPRALWSTSLGSHPSGNRRRRRAGPSVPRRGARRRADAATGAAPPPARPSRSVPAAVPAPASRRVRAAARRHAADRARGRPRARPASVSSRRSCCGASDRSPRRRRRRRGAPPRRWRFAASHPARTCSSTATPSGLRTPRPCSRVCRPGQPGRRSGSTSRASSRPPSR